MRYHASTQASTTLLTFAANGRLARLLQLFGGLAGKVVEFSANLPQSRRSKVLKKVRSKQQQAQAT